MQAVNVSAFMGRDADNTTGGISTAVPLSSTVKKPAPGE